MSLTFTGERFLPECAGEMVYEHWHRYLIAREYVAGKRVLDAPCGEGYGSHLLAAKALAVVGTDISVDAVAHANKRYSGANLTYVAANCTHIPEPDASFDVIISFEMIEHIHEQAEFLSEVARLLKPDGLFIISSPNRPEYSDRTGYKNEYHVKELDQAELKALLDPHFSAQQWFAQKAAFHSMVWPLDQPATSAAALAIDGSNAYPEAMYFMVFCARDASRLNGVQSQLSLVADREHSVYAEWSRTYRENAMLHQQIAALNAAPAASNDVVVEVPTVTEPWLVRVARRLTGSVPH